MLSNELLFVRYMIENTRNPYQSHTWKAFVGINCEMIYLLSKGNLDKKLDIDGWHILGEQVVALA